MNKEQAQTLIGELFTKPFDRKEYTKFLQNLLNRYEPRDGYYKGGSITKSFKKHVKQYWRVGKYVAPDGNELDLLVVEVNSLQSLERARAGLRNFAVNRLKTFGKDASLIAFYTKEDDGESWRFSFVKLEHEAYKDATGKVKTKQELTPARRYSYLVGVHENSHTASKQLLPLLEMRYSNPSIEEIEAAFGVEQVTSEFFEQYKSLFKNLSGHLKNDPFFKLKNKKEQADSVSRFAKKLLGQIVFLYFLQKKGWLGVPKDDFWGGGSKHFLRDSFDRVAGDNGNYYKDFLQHLFYDALANERKRQKDPGYYPKFDCRVPFLNGGLFEADYDWKNESVNLPNKLFHNKEKAKSGDVGTGILDVFDRYNFTIKEDEPLEKEVAVDPEMLGKVFENMLEITERKSGGAFYTPREIVHYICQESLINYLDNSLNSYPVISEVADTRGEMFSGVREQSSHGKKEIKVPKKDIETFIRKGHLASENDQHVSEKGKETDTYQFKLPESVRRHAEKIDSALATIKVCDPAIGSGAFPVGFLHEIVNARQTLDTYIAGANKKMDGEKTAYEYKRHAISESLYGVDRDPSAIDIARLRLWLSLIVDEQSPDNIEALPNLDYKIACGDSLVGFPEGSLNTDNVRNIEALKEKFLVETDHRKKAQLRQKIDAAINECIKRSQSIAGHDVSFDFRLMFSEAWRNGGGFDVVVGNPPYVQIQRFSGQAIQKAWQEQKYATYSGTGDIYCLFYEKGLNILKRKGTLAFITSNKWLRAGYGEKLRNFFAKETQPLTLIDFSSHQVFDTATVDTSIFICEKTRGRKVFRSGLISPGFDRSQLLDVFMEKHGIELPEVSKESWIICSREHFEIKKHIEKIGVPLKEWGIAINYGIKTGLNKAFIISGQQKDALIKADPKSAEIIKPILRGRDVKRYRVEFADLWLISTHNGYGEIPPVNMDDYPAVKAHLDGFLSQLKKRTDRGVTLYNLRNCAYMDQFSKEKIIYPETMRRARVSSRDFPRFTMDTKGEYVTDKTAYIVVGENLGWLTALLNSEITKFLIPLIVYSMDDSGFLMQKIFIDALPCVLPVPRFQEPVERLVQYRLEIGNDLPLEAAYIEQIINALVYEIYFSEKINVTKKNVLEHLGDLPPISEKMSKKERLSIIKGEFKRLYDLAHPVRNAIATLDSVNIVRTIRNAAKR